MVEATWRNLEQHLNALLQFAPTTSSAAEFHTALLSRIVPAVSARTAIFWTHRRYAEFCSTAPSDRASPPASTTWGLEALWGASREELFSSLESGIEDHAATIQRRILDQRLTPTPLAASSTMRAGEWWSALAPVSLDGRNVAVLEVLWPKTVPPGMQPNISNILAAFAEAASEFYRRRELQELRLQLEQAQARDGFALGLQCLADERAIAYTAANELGRFVECDRVTVLTRVRRWQVSAVSHSDAFDRRSPVIRGAERLAAVMAHDARPAWLHTTAHLDSLPPDLPWQNYLEESSTRSAALIPLMEFHFRERRQENNRSAAPIGALLIERFTEQPFTADEQLQIEVLARHVAAAFSRVAQSRHQSLSGELGQQVNAASSILLAVSIRRRRVHPDRF